MKKLSKLTESIWSDIQDRSSGETTRKEDDINLLDINELCEYLKTIYKTDSDNDIRVIEIEDNHQIETYLVVCLYEDESGYYRYIYYNGDYINTQLDVIETLNCRFEFERKFSTIHSTNDFDVVCIDIYPKDKVRVPVTNKFFIEVLDFILDRIDTPLEQKIEKITDVKESIWSDIQDRSAGETKRKEDDINLLDREGLYDYLIHHYKSTNHFSNISTSTSFNTIKVPIIINGGIYSVYFDFNTNEVYVHYSTLYMVNKLFIKVSKIFSLRSSADDDPKTYIISPKDGSKVTNRFFIDVVDFFIDNIPDSEGRAIKKIVNESIWSDIQDRSSGETVRKEDDINHMDSYEFWEYLHNTYISQHPNRDTIDYPIDGAIAMPFFMKSDFMMYMLWIEFNNNKIECISLPDVTVSKYDGIEDVFNLEGYYGDETRICVCPKDGSEITNSFAVKVIDYLLDQAVDDKYRMFIKKERS